MIVKDRFKTNLIEKAFYWCHCIQSCQIKKMREMQVSFLRHLSRTSSQFHKYLLMIEDVLHHRDSFSTCKSNHTCLSVKM